MSTNCEIRSVMLLQLDTISDATKNELASLAHSFYSVEAEFGHGCNVDIGKG